jgi:predicted site-specific integrase-resolvase
MNEEITMDMSKNHYTQKEAMAVLRISKPTLLNYIKKYGLKVVAWSNKKWIPKADVQKLITEIAG